VNGPPREIALGFLGYADNADLATAIAELWTAATDDPTRLPALTADAMSRADELGDTRGRFWLLIARTLFNYRDRTLTDSRADHAIAAALQPAVADGRGAHLLDVCEAALLLKEGRLDEAYALYAKLPMRSTPARDDADDVYVLHGRAVCAMSLGKLDEAFRADYANLTLTQRTGQTVRHCFTAAHLAGLLANIDRPEEGIELLEAPFRRWVRREVHPLIWTVAQHNLASCKQLAGRADEAFDEFADLLDSGVLTSYPMFAFNVYENLADLSIVLGRLDDARTNLDRAIECAQASGQAAWIGACELHAARLALAHGNTEEAIAQLEDAMARLSEDPDMSISTRVRMQVGGLLMTCQVERGNHARAFAAQSFQFAAYRAHSD
jgi:tetratricopeptide (TPR) repeat protein